MVRLLCRGIRLLSRVLLPKGQSLLVRVVVRRGLLAFGLLLIHSLPIRSLLIRLALQAIQYVILVDLGGISTRVGKLDLLERLLALPGIGLVLIGVIRHPLQFLQPRVNIVDLVVELRVELHQFLVFLLFVDPFALKLGTLRLGQFLAFQAGYRR